MQPSCLIITKLIKKIINYIKKNNARGTGGMKCFVKVSECNRVLEYREMPNEERSKIESPPIEGICSTINVYEYDY